MKTHFHDTHWPTRPLNRRYAMREAFVRLAISKHERWTEGERCTTTFVTTPLGTLLPKPVFAWFARKSLALSAQRQYGMHLTDDARDEHLRKMYHPEES